MRGQTERFLGHIPRHRAMQQSGNVPSVPLLPLHVYGIGMVQRQFQRRYLCRWTVLEDRKTYAKSKKGPHQAPFR